MSRFIVTCQETESTATNQSTNLFSFFCVVWKSIKLNYFVEVKPASPSCPGCLCVCVCINLINRRLPHMYLMNKDTSLLSGTWPDPSFPLILITKESVKLTMLIKGGMVPIVKDLGFTIGREEGGILCDFRHIFLFYTYFEPLLLDSICMLDYFIIILHIWDSVAAFLQLAGRHGLDEVHFVWGFHKGRVELSRDAGESLCEE